ncbi:MAG: hypothetical protein QOG58_4394, partial [Caballeronia sp.]|nr:hypothetical protein [Caballeronia sp.]
IHAFSTVPTGMLAKRSLAAAWGTTIRATVSVIEPVSQRGAQLDLSLDNHFFMGFFNKHCELLNYRRLISGTESIRRSPTSPRG